MKLGMSRARARVVARRVEREVIIVAERASLLGIRDFGCFDFFLFMFC